MSLSAFSASGTVKVYMYFEHRILNLVLSGRLRIFTSLASRLRAFCRKSRMSVINFGLHARKIGGKVSRCGHMSKMITGVRALSACRSLSLSLSPPLVRHPRRGGTATSAASAFQRLHPSGAIFRAFGQRLGRGRRIAAGRVQWSQRAGERKPLPSWPGERGETHIVNGLNRQAPLLFLTRVKMGGEKTSWNPN